MRTYNIFLLLLVVGGSSLHAMELSKKKTAKTKKRLSKKSKQEDWTKSAPGPLDLDKVRKSKKGKTGSRLSARGKKVKQHRSFSLIAKPEINQKEEDTSRQTYGRARSNSEPAFLIPDKIASLPLTPEVLPKTPRNSTNVGEDGIEQQPKTKGSRLAKMLLANGVTVYRQKNYATGRSGRDSMGNIIVKEYLGANAENALVANPSPKPSPRSEDTTTEEE